MTEAERGRQVALASAGDADALQRLLVEYHVVLYRLVAGSIDAAVRRRVEPDDVLQDAYVSAFRAVRAVASGLCTGRPDPDGPQVAAGASPADGGISFDSPASFYKWLERIVLNQLQDAERAARRKKRDAAREVAPGPAPATSYPDLLARITAGGTTPSRALSRQESVAALMTCLARLSDEQRAVVRLRFLEDVPVAEIAARLGKSEDAVYQHCHRGLKALRTLMDSLGGPPTRL